jgi:hypothetical protein
MRLEAPTAAETAALTDEETAACTAASTTDRIGSAREKISAAGTGVPGFRIPVPLVTGAGNARSMLGMPYVAAG